jgi:hypothetical protein
MAENLGLQTFVLKTLKNGTSTQTPDKNSNIMGDGNCFFRAISEILTGSLTQHKILRNTIIGHMNSACKAQLEKYLNGNMKKYLNDSNMLMDGVWATDAEILATASLLKTDILVHTSYGCDGKKWLRYPASFSLDMTSQDVILLEHSNEHFEPVLSLK